MKNALRPIGMFLVQIPLQLEYVKNKEDALVEVIMLLISVFFAISVMYAMKIKNKVPYTKFDVFSDYTIALFVAAVGHYAMLFYHSTYPRFIVDFAVAYFAYQIITYLKSAGDKKIKEIIEKVVGDTEKPKEL